MEALVSVHRSSELIVPDRPFSTMCNTRAAKWTLKENSLNFTMHCAIHRMHIKRNLLHCSALYYVWNRDVTFFGRDQNSEQLKRIETNFALHSLLFVGRRREREILLRTSLIKHCCSVLKAPQWVHLKTILHWSSVNIKQYYWSTIIKHDFKALL